MKVDFRICKKYVFLTVGVLLPFCCAIAQVPEVSYVYPGAALNTQPETLHIYGDNFVPDSIVVVKLVANGCPDIVASSIAVGSEHYLDCICQFNNAWAKLYNLVISNMSGADTLYGCFTVYMWGIGWWQTSTVGVGASYMSGVQVGDGDNNGSPEVYGSNYYGDVYRFECQDSVWVMSSIGHIWEWALDVCIGDGNNDGQIEVYAAYLDETIYQFKIDSTGWAMTQVGSGATRVTVGDGDGDGESEVYGANGTVYQYKWQGSTWASSEVGTGAEFIGLGDGDNDGDIEIYGGSSSVCQYEWHDTSWVRTTLDFNTSVDDIVLSDGNNDGEMELYCVDLTQIYQLKWNGASWVRTQVAAPGIVNAIAAGDGSGMGGQKLYAVLGDGTIHEFQWSGTFWIDTNVGSSGQMLDVAVGDGSDDGLMEVYGADADCAMYQFKIREIGIEEKTVRQNDGKPNMQSICHGNIEFPKGGMYKIYDICGRRIEVVNRDLVPGVYFIEEDGMMVHKVVVVR